MQTIVTDKAKETSSAAVNLPHIPNDILKLKNQIYNGDSQRYIYAVNKRNNRTLQTISKKLADKLLLIRGKNCFFLACGLYKEFGW